MPSVTTPRPTRIVGRRSRPLANRPTTGVATAPASSAAVSDHCAVPSLTSYAVATLGTSGAPRLLTTAVIVVSSASVGSSARDGAAPTCGTVRLLTTRT